jgi:hypothetical protein
MELQFFNVDRNGTSIYPTLLNNLQEEFTIYKNNCLQKHDGQLPTTGLAPLSTRTAQSSETPLPFIETALTPSRETAPPSSIANLIKPV